jgi:hypothetical protein
MPVSGSREDIPRGVTLSNMSSSLFSELSRHGEGDGGRSAWSVLNLCCVFWRIQFERRLPHKSTVCNVRSSLDEQFLMRKK